MSVRIQLRRDTAANWTATNPTLTQGEPGYETDTGKIKYGDGSTAWNSLAYASGGLPAAFAAGTAAAPGFAVDGDSNTGLYSPGADQLALSTNGTQRLLIDASGNVNIDSNTLYVDATNNRVGIGTSSPSDPLHVVGNIRGSIVRSESSEFQFNGGNSALKLVALNAQNVVKINPAGYWGTQIVGANDQGILVDNSGRVGIGTTTAGKTLHVYSSSFTFPARIETNGTGSGIELKDATTGANPPTVGAIGDDFYVTTNNNERFRCDSSGRLLVGTSSSSGNYLLEVNGAIKDSAGPIRSVPQNSQTSGYTLVASDTGKHISITTGGVTVPASVFSVGDVISIYNNSGSNQTITQGSSTTLRQAGTANTGNRTLAQYGVATVLCVASNTFVISGAGLS